MNELYDLPSVGEYARMAKEQRAKAIGLLELNNKILTQQQMLRRIEYARSVQAGKRLERQMQEEERGAVSSRREAWIRKHEVWMPGEQGPLGKLRMDAILAEIDEAEKRKREGLRDELKIGESVWKTQYTKPKHDEQKAA